MLVSILLLAISTDLLLSLRLVQVVITVQLPQSRAQTARRDSHALILPCRQWLARPGNMPMLAAHNALSVLWDITASIRQQHQLRVHRDIMPMV